MSGLGERVDGDALKPAIDNGYHLPATKNGLLCGLYPFMFTWGIVCGIDERGYTHRFCYASLGEAQAAYFEWLGNDAEEPSGYVKRK